jgi:hypothetical protein
MAGPRSRKVSGGKPSLRSLGRCTSLLGDKVSAGPFLSSATFERCFGGTRHTGGECGAHGHCGVPLSQQSSGRPLLIMKSTVRPNLKRFGQAEHAQSTRAWSELVGVAADNGEPACIPTLDCTHTLTCAWKLLLTPRFARRALQEPAAHMLPMMPDQAVPLSFCVSPDEYLFNTSIPFDAQSVSALLSIHFCTLIERHLGLLPYLDRFAFVYHEKRLSSIVVREVRSEG